MVALPGTLEHVDEHCFVALVNTEIYAGYVHDEATLEETMTHFTAHCARGEIAIIYTGEPLSHHVIELVTEPSERPAIQEAVMPLRVTGGRIWPTTYAALALCAQHADERLPVFPDSEHFIELPDGQYVVTFRLFQTAKELPADAEGPWPMEIVFEPGTAAAPEFLPWFG